MYLHTHSSRKQTARQAGFLYMHTEDMEQTRDKGEQIIWGQKAKGTNMYTRRTTTAVTIREKILIGGDKSPLLYRKDFPHIRTVEKIY